MAAGIVRTFGLCFRVSERPCVVVIAMPRCLFHRKISCLSLRMANLHSIPSAADAAFFPS